MDVTPRELRDIDIREGFRGYNRDDVDELLERAALTIEGLNERVRQLNERLTGLESQAGPARETEDILQRTLLLAQRAADEAVAEAQAKARQITEEADAKARATVAEAEAGARRLAEGERRRLENEVLDLGARRDALLADVEELERYETDYRARLRRAIEADLEALAGNAPVQPGPRPTIHEVDLPAAPEGVVAEEPEAAVAAETPAVPGPPVEPAPETASGVGPIPDAPPLPSWAKESEPPPVTEATGELEASPTGRPPLFEEDPVEPESLDDDAFFASLREAVSDTSPLGPREGQPERDFFTEEDDDASRGLFRRRR